MALIFKPLSRILLVLYACIVSTNMSAQNALMVQFPSPEATNLGLVGNLPVSLHTGKASTNIPINVGKDKMLPPISLSYNTSGVQPDVHPGWVGNNWTLNAGGVVTRIMDFIPDETEQIGYYYKYAYTGTITLPISFTSPGDGGSTCWNDLCTTADGCPDEFYVNADGLSGQFMINSYGKFQMIEDPSVKVEIEGTGTPDYPRLYDVLEGGTTHPFRGFTITKNDGTKYRFGYLRELIETSCNIVNNAPSGSGYATAWYLQQIIYPNGEVVNYTYTPKVQNRTPSGNTVNYTSQLSPLPNGDYPAWDGRGYIYRTATFHAYLKSIESTSTRLDFFTSTTNELKNGLTDLQNWKRLDSIVVYNKFKAAREKSFEFTYDSAANKRLTLLSVMEKGINGSLPPHQFVYNNAVKLPPYQSGQTDFYGYYNSNPEITTLATTVWPDGVNMPFYFSLNREPNPTFVQADILKQIKYPTGGSVLLEYEPNDYSYFYDYTLDTGQHYFQVKWRWDESISRWILYKFGNANGQGIVVQFFEITTPIYATITGPGLTNPRNVTLPVGHYDIAALQRFLGIPVNTADNVQYAVSYKKIIPVAITKKVGPGLRVKKIYHKSSESSIDLVKEYIYSKDYSKQSYNPQLSSGILGNRPNFVLRPSPGANGSGQSFATPQGPAALTEGSPLGYSEVTEITKDKNDSVLGFVTTRYSNFDAYPDDVAPGGGTNYIAVGKRGNKGYQRGKLIESVTYDYKGKMVKKLTNIYDFYSPPSSVGNGVLIRPNYGEDPNQSINPIYMVTRYYFNTCKISSSTEIAFDTAGSNGVETYSTYFYNQYKLPSSKELRTSTGKFKKTNYRYPFDVTSPVYSAMTRRNMLNYPIESISYLESEVIGSTLNLYKPVVGNLDTMFLPDKSYKLETNSSLSAFTLFDGTTKDLHYISPNLEAGAYDGKGNPLEVKDQAGMTTVYLWGYNGQYPVARIVGSDFNTVKTKLDTAILNSGTDAQISEQLTNLRNAFSSIPTVQVFTYTYKPIIGMTSETDPKGNILNYEYDGFGRLKLIKDQNSKILKQYNYDYQQPITQ
ncbi:hypothetical protein [Chitinophaga sp. 212800010-3]|uniref:hypothetical protein n=1 Tax=unclassified Chitinophaga TaxID=2619133 RepID=UPI002DE2E3A2|nr:hypothetical protein [Chitinophaga sp. 212800010-3]